jgi:hypothetical protein
MITGLLYSLSIGAAWLLLRIWTGKETVFSTDSGVYAGMAQGVHAPDPYRLRWLLPFLMPKRADFRFRATVSAVGLWLTFPALYLFATASGVNGLWACAIWGALPVMCILWRLPGLIDQVSWPVGLLTGYLFLSGHVEAGIVLSLIGGLIEPKLPVMVAAWTLNPWALTGLLSVGAVWKWAPRGTVTIMENPEPILHPWRSGMKHNGSLADSAREMLLPWGACLAGLCAMTVPVLLSLAAAYGQLLRATDRVRLYQWAAPVMIVAALNVLPEWSLPLAVAVTWFNPRRGEE